MPKVRIIKKPRNDIIIEAIEKSAGLIKPAAAMLKVPRRTLQYWIADNPELKSAVEDAKESVLDMVEGNMYKQAKEGNTTILIFLAKTLGKSRGYVEKSQHEHSGSIGIKTVKDLSNEELDTLIRSTGDQPGSQEGEGD